MKNSHWDRWSPEFNGGGGGPSYDSDAQAFFTASGLSDSAQKDAVNQLVLDLKAASIWTKMLAVYPFVGGTSTTHKFSLKNPADTDAAFRITWGGAATHNANGVTWLGNTADYGNTHIVPNTDQTGNDVHYSIYSKTNNANNEYEFGSDNFKAAIALFGGTSYGVVGSFASALDSPTNSFYVVSSTDLIRMYKASALIATGGAGSVNSANPIFLGGYRNPITGTDVIFPSTKNHALISFGTGLTAGDITALGTAVTTYQTALGRQN
jgi:hypothetical protein